MNASPVTVTYSCPGCGRTSACQVHPEPDASSGPPAAIACPACSRTILPPPAAFRDGHLTRCLVCPGTDLFLRKDFPQKLGVGIVVVGFLASCVAWGMRELVWTFGILFATAAVDVVLYLFMPECLACYRCGARYRGREVTGDHRPFDLAVHERERQGLARERQLRRAAEDRS
jgi:DNA-directed RNA polymerase subunit RPC12/RpoP